jgi:UDPglucose 6-dehydrogenase
MLDETLASGAVSFTSDPPEALDGAQIAFLCVGTPNDESGNVDLRALVSAARSVAEAARPGTVIVSRSTAPVGTAAYLRSLIEESSEIEPCVAVNPEFLAEGTAIRDFVFPDRIVIGAWDEVAADRVRETYAPIVARDLPESLMRLAPKTLRDVVVIQAEPPTAELVKYASNAFLALKISFINEIATIAEQLGADVTQVAQAVGLDRRIGPDFLRAGVGWGGSCFPKDIQALHGMASAHGVEARLLRAANDVNRDQHRWVVRKLQRYLKSLVGRRVALLGLAFKPDTDDLRDAPSLDIASELAREHVRVRAFDPVVRKLSGYYAKYADMIEIADDPVAAARGCDAVVLVTEWAEFRDLDLQELAGVMRHRLFLDGRNHLDPSAVRAAGFTYVGVGRHEIA